MKKILTALVVCFALITLAACSNSSNKNQSDQQAVSSMPKIDGFTYYGKVPKNPKKVVNFAYSYTGYLFQLGVDVSSYSLDYEKDSPAFGNKLKDAKKLTSEDTEAIAAQKPDLIIAFSTDKNIKQLKKIAPVLVIEYGKNDYLQMLTNLAKVFDKEDKAKEWLKNWKDKTAQAKEELKDYIPENTTFTVMDFYDKDLYLYGNNWGRGGELVYDALGYLAPQKVKDEVFKKGWYGVSQEVIGDYIGDYALLNVSDSSKNAAASLKESDVWQNIPAVQNKHILEVDENLFYFSDPMSLDAQLKSFVDAVKKANS
ncbi:ABC transporter substrate-binding protein [Streptococcus dentapri]|uniref:ABC transporter substrate-binding protein n=1 Tax=Streptococcus dentapri TaxID=573564 RepID=A0ABV8D2E4_9STRE